MLCLFVPDCNKSCLSLSFVSFSCYRKTITMSDSKFKFPSLRNVDLVINYFVAPLFPIRCSSLRGCGGFAQGVIMPIYYLFI